VSYFLLGTFVNLVCAVIAAGVLQIFFDLPFDPGLTSIFGITMVIPSAYAMTRQRLFDIRVVLSRLVFTGFSVVFFFSLHYAIFNLLRVSILEGMAFAFASLLTGLLAFFGPVLPLIRKIASRLIQGQSIESDELIRRLVDIIISVRGEEDL